MNQGGTADSVVLYQYLFVLDREYISVKDVFYAYSAANPAKQNLILCIDNFTEIPLNDFFHLKEGIYVIGKTLAPLGVDSKIIIKNKLSKSISLKFHGSNYCEK